MFLSQLNKIYFVFIRYLAFLGFMFFYPITTIPQKIEIKILIQSSEFVITNLDAMFECNVYKIYKLSDLKNCNDEKVLKSFAILSILRKRIENFIGFQEDILRYVIDGKWNEMAKIDEEKEKEFDYFVKFGYSIYDIQEEARKILIFSEKLKNTLGIEIKNFIDFSYNYVSYGENFLQEDFDRERKVQMKIIYDFIKSFLLTDLRF